MYKDNFFFGREDRPHVTTLYGIHTIDISHVVKRLEHKKPFFVRLGKISLFQNELFDVVKIECKNHLLHQLHADLKLLLRNSEPYETYEPHVTIAYVNKGCYNNLEGNITFNKRRWKVKELEFSSRDGRKERIKLNGR